MYDRIQLIRALKSLAAEDDSQPNKTHKQLLDYHAQRLNFQSYHHFQRWLNSAPDTALGSLSTRLMRGVCASKSPSFNEPYYEFIAVPNGLSFYSHWIGYDSNGYEVRVPRPLDGQYSVPALRKLFDRPIYVVEHDSELLSWQYQWKATAYVADRLARQYFNGFFTKDHLVDHNVPEELVRLRVAESLAKIREGTEKMHNFLKV